MRAEPFTWDDLRLVLAIADGRGLGGAAKRLGIDPSTAFRRLGALEGRLGLPLFERHRSGYVATRAGEDMAALAGRMTDEAAALSRRLAGQASLPEGELRVTTNDALLVHLLTPIFARFLLRHPGMRLDIVLSNDALNLSRRDADVAVRVTSEPPETLVGRRLATIGWALYGRADRAPGGDGEERWVGLSEPLDGIAPARFVRRRASPERIVYRVNTVLALADAVELGIGIGPLPCYIADRRPGLARLAPPDPDLAGPLWLLTHPDLRATPRVRALLDQLADEIARAREMLAGTAPA